MEPTASKTPMSDMLDLDDSFTAPLPEGFDLEQYKQEVKDAGGDYDAFCKAFPLFEHPAVEPPTNETYWEFGRTMKRMGRGPDSYNDTQYNLVRATCEYLTAQSGTLPDLTAVDDFLGRGWQPVLADLQCYPPVAPLLAYAQHLVTCRLDDANHSDPYMHIDTAVSQAQLLVLRCIDFLETQQKRAQEAEELAELERQQRQHQADYEHAKRMVKRHELILKAMIFALGIGVGWLVAHSS